MGCQCDLSEALWARPSVLCELHAPLVWERCSIAVSIGQLKLSCNSQVLRSIHIFADSESDLTSEPASSRRSVVASHLYSQGRPDMPSMASSSLCKSLTSRNVAAGSRSAVDAQ
jgi:hypothetical protein